MRSDKELLQEALTALQIFGDTIPGNSVIVKKAINNIGARLAESEDEPFCYVALGTDRDDHLYWDRQQAMDDGYAFVEPLYRRPPRQTGLDQLLERIRFLEQQIAEKNQ